MTVSVGAAAGALTLVLDGVADGSARLSAPQGDLAAGVACRQLRTGAPVQLTWGDDTALHVVGAVVRGFDRDGDTLVVVPTEASSRQRRDSARAAVRLPVRAAWFDFGQLAQIEGFTRNVSSGGAAVVAPIADLGRMASAPEVLLSLTIGADVVRAVGRVLEVVPAPGFARVQFSQIADRDQTALGRAVQAELIEQRRRVL